jgi:hypothetical protein
MMKPYPMGYTAASTDDFNRDDPQCQFGGLKDAGVWLAEQTYPSGIELHVRVTPIWLENNTAVAKLNDHSVCLLYPAQSVFSHVRVDAMGTGQYQKASGEERISFIGTRILDYELDLPTPSLYQKKFLVQPEGRSIHWIASERIPPLWAYGGQQIGDDIHPFVVTLESARDETLLHPTSLLYWRERGFLLSGEWANKTEAAFQDAFAEDQMRTLIESIEAGMSTIYLKLGIDEIGDSLKIPYHSYRLSKGCLFYKKGGQM